MLYHFVYMTTNLVNKKYYIGFHTTKKLEDGYLGSGILLTRSIKKYGSLNFKRDIIQICETEKEALSLEEKLVDETLLDPLCYNVRRGGEKGSFAYINNKAKTDVEFRKKKNAASRRNILQIPREVLVAHGKAATAAWKGRKHKQSSRLLMQQIQKGNKNSAFGSRWIFNTELKQSKRIYSSDEVNIYLNAGWQLGRRIKF